MPQGRYPSSGSPAATAAIARALAGERSTGIEWTSATWNPWVGCSIVSAGCSHCYAMSTAHRLEGFGQASYQGTTRLANGNPVWTGRVNRATSSAFRKPLTIREPSLIFTCSMADFFSPDARDEWRLEAFDIMRNTPRHQYQVLTKRPDQVAPFLARQRLQLPDNAWLGATVEREDVLHRIDTIRAVAARVRFLSVEPLLGPLGQVDLTGIHWVIVGGESGPGARAMHVDWVRDIRDQCQAQGVSLFLKQFGKPENNPLHAVGGAELVRRQDPIGKGGSTLDGCRWTEFPAL